MTAKRLLIAVFPDRECADEAMAEFRKTGLGETRPVPSEPVELAALPPPPRPGEFEPRQTVIGLSGEGERLAWEVADQDLEAALRVVDNFRGVAEVA